jgi:hypothetical protein
MNTYVTNVLYHLVIINGITWLLEAWNVAWCEVRNVHINVYGLSLDRKITICRGLIKITLIFMYLFILYLETTMDGVTICICSNVFSSSARGCLLI